MTDVLLVALRGFCQVAPVAASTVCVARGKYLHAAGMSFVISWVWWENAGSAAHLMGAGWASVYATGACLGTLTGMAIARRLVR